MTASSTPSAAQAARTVSGQPLAAPPKKVMPRSASSAAAGAEL
ncbi:MAG TPA: hypothetical protein VGH77_17155 [Streptosporangiaceae bacterium]